MMREYVLRVPLTACAHRGHVSAYARTASVQTCRNADHLRASVFIRFYRHELTLLNQNAYNFFFAEFDFVRLSERFDNMADRSFGHLLVIAEQTDKAMRRNDGIAPCVVL